eukprot:m.160241 g.160241  ORF g.160241 m.160241 type:complete len:1581 (+) comp13382_c0_seq6:71-4813(+)
MPPPINERVLEYAVLFSVDLKDPQKLDKYIESKVFPPIAIFQGNPNHDDDFTVQDLFLSKEKRELQEEFVKREMGVIGPLCQFAFPQKTKVSSKPPSMKPFVFPLIFDESNHRISCLRFHLSVPYTCFDNLSAGDVENLSCNGDGEATRVYVPLALCLVSHTPTLSLHHDIASFLYRYIENGDCKINLIEEVVRIGTWIPLPLSGSLSFRFFIEGQDFICTPSPHECLPLYDWYMLPLFRRFPIDRMIKLMVAIMLETSVVVLSSNIALLAPFCQLLLTLMAPFVWTKNYIPCLPDDKFEMVEAPVPYIIGMHYGMRTNILEALGPDSTTILVDLNNGRIRLPSALSLPQHPRHLGDNLKYKLRTLKPFPMFAMGRPVVDVLHDKHAQLDYEKAADMELRMAWLGFTIDMLKGVKTCIDFNYQPPIFNEDKFLELQPVESYEFYSKLIKSDPFHFFILSRSGSRNDCIDLFCEQKSQHGKLQLCVSPQDFFIFQLHEDDDEYYANKSCTWDEGGDNLDITFQDVKNSTMLSDSCSSQDSFDDSTHLLPFSPPQGMPMAEGDDKVLYPPHHAKSPIHGEENDAFQTSQESSTREKTNQAEREDGADTLDTDDDATVVVHSDDGRIVEYEVSTAERPRSCGDMPGNTYSDGKNNKESSSLQLDVSRERTKSMQGIADIKRLQGSSSRVTDRNHKTHKQHLRQSSSFDHGQNSSSFKTKSKKRIHLRTNSIGGEYGISQSRSLLLSPRNSSSPLSSKSSSKHDSLLEQGNFVPECEDDAEFKAFCYRTIDTITRENEKVMNMSVKRGLVFARAIFYISCGHIRKGVEDLNREIGDAMNFPFKRVARMLNTFSESDLEEFKTATLSSHKQLWDYVFELADNTKESETESLRSIQWGRLLMESTGGMDKPTFISIGKLSDWLSERAATTIFLALTDICGHEGGDGSVTLPSELCREFYKSLSPHHSLDSSVYNQLNLVRNEGVVAYVKGAIVLFKGVLTKSQHKATGTLILTHRRLMFLSEGKRKELQQLARLGSIAHVTLESKTRFFSTQTYINVEDKEVISHLSNLDNIYKWFYYIDTMRKANQTTHNDDTNATKASASSIVQLQAVYCVLSTNDKKYLQHPPTEKMLDILKYDSRNARYDPTTQSRRLAPKKGSYKRILEITPDGERKRTVECVTFVDAQKKCWCGMSDGCIEVVDFNSFVKTNTLKIHTQRVTTVFSFGFNVWTGSLDETATIINGETMQLVEKLHIEEPCVVLNYVEHKGYVFGCTDNGKVLCWLANGHELVLCMDFKDVAERVDLRHIVIWKDEAWLASSKMIIIASMPMSSLSDAETDNVSVLLREDEEHSLSLMDQFEMGSFVQISSEVHVSSHGLHPIEEEGNDDDSSVFRDDGVGEEDISRKVNNSRDTNHLSVEGNDIRKRRSSSVREWQGTLDSNVLSTIETKASHGICIGVECEDSCEVWCFSNRKGLIEIRNQETKNVECHFRLDGLGFNDIVATSEYMWAACNDGELYVFDKALHYYLQQFRMHSDSVRCIVSFTPKQKNNYGSSQNEQAAEVVITGGASEDGRLIEWNPQFLKRDPNSS